MTWIYGATRPETVTEVKRFGQMQRTINFCVEPTETAGYNFRWKSVTLDIGVWGYDPIVNAIVSEKYPADKMQAVVNNYLAAPSDEQAQAEMAEMQAWRILAKNVAHDLTD